MNNLKSESLPHFLCIGAQKAATTWLWTMLRQHPEIWMPPIKELHFFDHIYIPKHRYWTLYYINCCVKDYLKLHVQTEKIDLSLLKYLVDLALSSCPFTEEWYRSCFARPAACGKLLGDISPDYCTISEEGVLYVKKLLGEELKIIYMIRNPFNRAISQLKMNLTRRGEEGGTDDFWLAAAKDPVIVQRGDYETYVPRWESIFPKLNILYLPYGDVINDPSGLLRKTEKFLGISNHHYKETEKRVNETKEAYVPQVAVNYLKQLLAPQSEFLIKHFGEAFYDKF